MHTILFSMNRRIKRKRNLRSDNPKVGVAKLHPAPNARGCRSRKLAGGTLGRQSEGSRPKPCLALRPPEAHGPKLKAEGPEKDLVGCVNRGWSVQIGHSNLEKLLNTPAVISEPPEIMEGYFGKDVIR